MKRIFFCFFLILLSQGVAAIGISPDAVRIEFVPNFENVYHFRTQQSPSTLIMMDGELKQYVTIENNKISADGSFDVRVKLPQEIPTPGDNVVFVGVVEGTVDSSMVSGVASVRTAIVIRVPYPGVYADVGFNAPDMNTGETAKFVVSIRNLGKTDISDAKSSIDIIDSKGTVVKTLNTDPAITIKSGETENLAAIFNSSGHEAGNYRAIAHVQYLNEKKDLEDSFRIGSLKVNLADYTKEFSNDEIVKFDLVFESGWNSDISGIFSNVRILNNSNEISAFQTVSFDLKPWERKTISTYWSKLGIGVGEYDAEITAFYGGISDKSGGKIRVVMPDEGKSLDSSFKYLNLTSLLILAIAVLVIVNLFFFFRRRRKENEGV